MITSIIASVSAGHMEYMQHVLTQFEHHRVTLTKGAETRHRSIYNAVKAIPDGVLITFKFLGVNV